MLVLRNIKLQQKTKKEKVSFFVIYENHSRLLSLVAPSEVERDRWVRVFQHLIATNKANKALTSAVDYGIVKLK